MRTISFIEKPFKEMLLSKKRNRRIYQVSLRLHVYHSFSRSFYSSENFGKQLAYSNSNSFFLSFILFNKTRQWFVFFVFEYIMCVKMMSASKVHLKKEQF